MRHTAKPLAAICGLGLSEIARSDVGTPRDLAIDAITSAIADCGVGLSDLDGLLVTCSPSAPPNTVPLRLAEDLALGDLTLTGHIQVEGASVVAAIQQASLCIHHGMATTVACVFADAPLRTGQETGSAAFNRALPLSGLGGWDADHGLYSAVGAYALAARRYLHVYGLDDEAFGSYAVTCRRWAADNPQAKLRTAISLDDYRASRLVVEPFRVLDCAYPVNGAIAVVITSCDRARSLRQPPVYLHAFAQGHPGSSNLRGFEPELESGASIAAKVLWRATGLGPAQIEMAQLYDAFSYVPLLSLEEYGLCGRGEAPYFVAEGNTAPGGTLPLNTGGGHLSGFYLQGMTPVSEAVIQARGQGGARQCSRNNVILVTGVGGRLDYHACMLVSPHAEM